MLPRMTYRVFATALLSVSVFALSACGPDPDTPILAGNTQAASGEGEALYQKAKQADDAGKSGSAIKLYDQVATRYPFA